MSSNSKVDSMRRYPPTLLDRLQDDEPKSFHDRFNAVDMKTMRRIVQKDITDLLNHSNMEERLDERKHKFVMESVLNYGISPLIGAQENRHNWHAIEQKIRKTILCFEPRIIPESLLISSLQDKDDRVRYGNVFLEIRGLIYWKPHPVDLCMSGRYDFESEKVELRLM